MNFQLALPYATDSNLHVIEGLDVTGAPIYQRPGDWRFEPADMYTLLQGIIERCLATQLPSGNYLVSPTIYDETMFSTEEHISFAPISKWTERTYPDGVLNEVSGYVRNLMDNYPQWLLLLAIDDKIWQLGQCVEGPTHMVSFYGTYDKDTHIFVPYDDVASIFQAAGVGYDPVSNQLLLIPGRLNGGVDVYGAPNSGARIYPEVLIARYKVLQVMRYCIPSIYDAAKSSASFSEVYTETGNFPRDGRPQFYPNWYYYNMYWYDWYKETACNIVLDQVKVKVADPSTWGTDTFENMTLFRHTKCAWNIFNVYMGANYWEVSLLQTGPVFKIKAYDKIPKALIIIGEYSGGETAGLKNADGGELVVGKNELRRWENSTSSFEEFKSEDGFPHDFEYEWNASTPNGYTNANCSIPLTLLADYHFQFCKHSEFGGDATWTP
jgi:hypothetical protein